MNAPAPRDSRAPRRATTRGRVLVALALVIATADVALVISRAAPTDDTPAAAPAAPSPTPRSTETLGEQLRRVARVVERIRGLSFPAVPETTYLSADELAERVAMLVDEYPEEQAELDQRILRTLGAIPRDYDLRGALVRLLSEQVAGFYDPRTGELVVRANDAGRRLSPVEELFLAHELQHALADVTLGLPEDPERPGGEDAAVAGSALIEGDATLTMQEYVSVGFTALDRVRFAGESLGLLSQTDRLSEAPWVLRRSLEFPYVEGLAFVRSLRARSGWAAVNAAYERPPTSTAQILFPERYGAGAEPLAPGPPGALGAPWERRTRTSFGAADLLFLLEAPGDDRSAALDHARTRTAAWGGGALTLWTHGARDAVALVLRERTPSGDLCDTVVAWYLKAFPSVDPARTRAGEVLAVDGSVQDAVVRCDGATVRVGIAPDLATARTAAG